VRALLATRDARLYFAGQSLSLFGDTALWLAMGVWAKQLTGSNTAAGLVFLAFTLPQLAAPLSGWLVDRVRRRTLLLATNLATAAAVLPLVLVRDAGDVWLIYAVMVLYGISATLINSGQSALLTTMLPEELLAHGNALLQTVREGLRLVGPLLGAGLFAVAGGGAVAILDAATFLGASAALAAMALREPPPAPPERHLAAELAAGVRHVLGHPGLRRLTSASIVAICAFGCTESVVFAVVDQGLHRPPPFVGVFLALQGVGAIATGIAAPALVRRIGEGGIVVLGLALAAGGMPLLALSSLPVVVAGVIVFGASLPLIMVGSVTMLQRSTPLRLQGRAYSAFDLMVGTPQTIAIGVGAGLVAAVDYRAMLAGMTLLLALAALWLAVGLGERRTDDGLELAAHVVEGDGVAAGAAEDDGALDGGDRERGQSGGAGTAHAGLA
jgi:Na+/melibiose symporter-like transporter